MSHLKKIKTYSIYMSALMLSGPSLVYGSEEECKNPGARQSYVGQSPSERVLEKTYASKMYTKLVFSAAAASDEPVVEFNSHELVRIVQDILKNIGSTAPTKIPPYATYEHRVEVSYKVFMKALLSKAAVYYGVSDFDLNRLIDGFYEYGPSATLFGLNETQYISDPYGEPGNQYRLSGSATGLYYVWEKIMNQIKGGRLQLTSQLSVGREDENIPSQRATIGQLISGSPDQYILPPHIVHVSSAAGWLGLARHVRDNREPEYGWWLNVGDRLILLKNSKKQDLYVSDHGFQDEVLSDTMENLVDFANPSDDIGYFFEFMQFYSYFEEKGSWLLPIVKERFVRLLHKGYGGTNKKNKRALLISSFPPSILNTALSFLSQGKDIPGFYFNSYIGGGNHCTELVLPAKELEDKLGLDPYKRKQYEQCFQKTLEQVRHNSVQSKIYFTNSMRGSHDGTRFQFDSHGGLGSFFTQIDNIFHPEDAQKFRIYFVLKEMAKKLGKGMQECMFRPVHSFGSREDGESYRSFAEAVDQYYTDNSTITNKALATEMRSILKGNRVSEESLYFLPNLVAAWFVSEVARNESSAITGLMLLDLIESGVNHIDGDGKNLYEWRHTLVHPRKPKDSRTNVGITDLYGVKIDLAKFDGIHPMAHGDSVAHSKAAISNGTKLSAVRQKEGHLIVDWLCKRFSRSDSRLVSMSVSEQLSLPDYKEIDRLLDAGDKPSKGIKKDKRLYRKWNILQTIKQFIKNRLGTLDNMLVDPADKAVLSE